MQIVVILTTNFSEHITIFRTLSIDIWQHKSTIVNNDKQIKQKMANFILQTFQNYQIFPPHSSEISNMISEVSFTNRNSSALLLHAGKTFSNLELFFIFSFTYFYFFGTYFRYQNKSNVVETISCFVYQLSKKKNIAYILCLNT